MINNQSKNEPINFDETDKKTFGAIIADKVAKTVGSWKFIIIQSSIILLWIILNTVGFLDIPKWDPFPFIFLNLALSFQAAYTAPIIMMSQNRDEKKDRQRAEADYEINKLAENEIEDVQEKLYQLSNFLIKKDEKINQNLEKINNKMKI